MAIQFDLIIPPVIIGFLILILFRINSFMMDTSVDNRLGHEMQSFADVTVVLIQNELRTLKTIEALTDSTIRFSTTEADTIEIFREGRNLNITRIPSSGSPAETTEHASRLKSLSFTPKEMAGSVPALLHFRVVTESTPDQQVGPDNGKGIRAYSEKQVYLRNIFYQ